MAFLKGFNGSKIIITLPTIIIQQKFTIFAKIYYL